MNWTLAEVAGIVGGVAVGEAEVRSVATDSREVAPGTLFVALRGDRHDGHEFLTVAFDHGAAAAMVEPGRLPDGVAGVEVADPLAALAALAAARRARLTAPVVAVTGSTGKTTTKDFIAAALGPGCHAAPRSFNNEVGVPLTVLGCPDDATALVVEVGSRGVGHIAALAPVVRPDVAVITNIGPAHLEMFGDLATVRKAKWELVLTLGPNGVAVLPAADRELCDLRDGARITFGEEGDADVAAREVVLDAGGRTSFDLEHAGHRVRVVLPVPGRHQPVNAAAAVAAALALGRDFEEAVVGLAGVRLSPWRMAIDQRRIRGGVVTVVNDAYNANPASMESALVTVADMPGRRFAVLGMMHELGERSAELHRAVGMRATELAFRVVVVGEDPGIATGAGDGTVSVPDVAAAASALAAALRPGDVVLVKASRATGLESLPDLIGGVL